MPGQYLAATNRTRICLMNTKANIRAHEAIEYYKRLKYRTISLSQFISFLAKLLLRWQQQRR